MQKIQILLVEDHLGMRRLIRSALVAEGYCVVSVGDFERFKMALGAGTPDLAIVDFRFPLRVGRPAEACGVVVQRVLRKAGVPILGTSFDEQCPTRPDLGDFGDKFLCKSADGFLDDLLAAVQRLLGEVGGEK